MDIINFPRQGILPQWGFYGPTAKLRRVIAALFSQGQQGVMYVPQSTVLGQQVLYQDSAGTTPVTADGDPVGRADDLSPNGNNATQLTSADRPLYGTDGSLYWLSGNSSNWYMEAGTVPWLSSSDAIAYIAISARRVTGDPGYIVFDSGSANLRPDQSFSIADLGDGTVDFVVGGTKSPALTVTQDFTLEIRFDKSTGDCEYRTNDSGWVSMTVGTVSSISNLRIFSREGGVYFGGRLYGLVGRQGTILDSNADRNRDYLADRAGITL